MWAWHVKMATQNLLKFTRQRIVYSFLKLWRAFLDWNHIVKPFYLLKFTRQRIAYSFLKLWRAFLDWNHIVKPFYLLNILFRFCMYNELNFPFPFLMAPMKNYIRWAYLVNHIICGNSITTAISFRPETSKGRAGCFILRGNIGNKLHPTSSVFWARTGSTLVALENIDYACHSLTD